MTYKTCRNSYRNVEIYIYGEYNLFVINLLIVVLTLHFEVFL